MAGCSGSTSTRWQTFWRVIFPTVLPALITGFAMAFARALGEYGSVIFISGDRFLETQIVSSVIVTELFSGDDRGEMIAASIAITMLFASFSLMFIINLLQLWSKRGG